LKNVGFKAIATMINLNIEEEILNHKSSIYIKV